MSGYFLSIQSLALNFITKQTEKNMRKLKLLLSGLLFTCIVQAQETFPVNGIADKREHCYAFTNATIVQSSTSTLQKATLVIRDGKIVRLM